MPKKTPSPSPAVSGETVESRPKRRTAKTASASTSNSSAASPRKRIAKPKTATLAKDAKVAATALTQSAPIEVDLNQYHDEVARLAYHLWLERGGAHGNPEEDWFRAQEQLKQQLVAKAATA